MQAAPGVELVACSSWYETDPVGPPPQGPYLNGAAGIDTTLEPAQLLALLHRVEAEAGRERGDVRWTARTLDLDLLLHGDRVIERPDLVVPHPRLHERAFVLVPLVEIASAVRHPVLGQTVAALARAVAEEPGIRLHCPAPDVGPADS